MASYYRQQLEAWLKAITVKAESVVDVGGAANPVLKRLGNSDVQLYTCLDNGVEEPKVSYVKFDINKSLHANLDGYSIEDIAGQVVFCLEVFEYVWNPVQAIQNLYNLTKADGFLYISFPAIYPVHNPVEIDYLRYTKMGVTKLLSEAGFENIEITPRIATEGRDFLGAFYSAEKMHPVKHSQLPYDIGYLVKCWKPYVQLSDSESNRS